MKNQARILLVLVIVSLVTGCSGSSATATPPPTNTPQPTDTSAPTAAPKPTDTSVPPTPTSTPTQTVTPTKTPKPTPESPEYTYLTLGGPITKECGVPHIVVDDALNGDQNVLTINNRSGHVDLYFPSCNVDSMQGEVLSVIPGTIKNTPHSTQFWLPENTHIAGIENALEFRGRGDYSLSDIIGIYVDYGHINLAEGLVDGMQVEKGQSIGDIANPAIEGHALWKLAYQIHVHTTYGEDLVVSPSLFVNDTTVPMNFSPPDNPMYDLIYPDGMAPFLCGNVRDWSWACYAEPNAQHSPF